jgi:hypothetical protein
MTLITFGARRLAYMANVKLSVIVVETPGGGVTVHCEHIAALEKAGEGWWAGGKGTAFSYSCCSACAPWFRAIAGALKRTYGRPDVADRS